MRLDCVNPERGQRFAQGGKRSSVQSGHSPVTAETGWFLLQVVESVD